MNYTELISELNALKQTGTSFLGCVAFVQKELNISLFEAKELVLKIDVFSSDEKDKIKNAIQIMLSEFKNK